MLTSAIVGGLVGLAISFRLPDVRILPQYFPSNLILTTSRANCLPCHGEANREVIPLDKISPELKRAVMAIEDSHFYFTTALTALRWSGY